VSPTPISGFEAAEETEVLRITTDGPFPEVVAGPFHAAVEAPLVLDIVGTAVYTILCSPMDLEPLALGFLFSQGIIAHADEVAAIEPDAPPGMTLRIHLRNPAEAKARQRHMVIVSAGGLSEGPDDGQLLEELPRVGDTLRVAADRVRAMVETMRSQQTIFPQSGGTHAAAIFAADGTLSAFAEDIGRHNALDKAVGKCLAAGCATAGGSVALSGRVSYEMVMKCARAGLELISAVSAPTSLAIAGAHRSGISLCTFVRDNRATVCAGPHRIAGLPAA
jgi:FdhD protein